jgi:choline dehydrogenase-like flavoprotein
MAARPDTTIETDVCIIGAGPSGAVVAAHAARDGRRVVMIERGGWYSADHQSHHESSVVATVFKDGGLQTNSDFDFYILQAQCVGGSGAVSNAVAFRMPPGVHKRWVDEFGFPGDWATLEESYKRIEASSDVAPAKPCAWSPGTHKFLAGCRELGLPEGSYKPFDKAIKDCIACGMCNNGCPYEKRRTSEITYTPDAVMNGARILPYHEAVKVVTRGGKVTELVVKHIPKDGPPSYKTIRADIFILAAGAINSAAILLRSDIRGRGIGRGISFNVGATCVGQWDEVIDPHLGDDMCAFYMCDDYTCESTINPPGALSMFITGSFEELYEQMMHFRHMFQIGLLVGSESNGKVVWDLKSRLLGHEFVKFRMTPGDLAKVRAGLITAAKIHLAGGAKRVFLPLARPAAAHSYEEAETILNARLRKNSDLNAYGSAHPFGGLCLSADPRKGALDTDFRVRGLANLYCCDASTFPTSIKVNPMISIMAVADYFATHVLQCPPIVTGNARIAELAGRREAVGAVGA